MNSNGGIKKFGYLPGGPKLPPGVEGIVINVRGMAGGAPLLQGHCRLSNEGASLLKDSLLHNIAIVCTYGSSLRGVAFPLIQDEMVFEEDVQREQGFQQAFFNVALNTVGLPAGEGQYYILASFHTFLSEVIVFH